ncbi:MAG: hypothetical protein DWQ47_12700 [Acidobacteria bacterium]|nr:MAG: hypothetical protein DWQ32_00100 [Acidobacteriota bacterium]REK03055.1 MAG: hypothetical protein DWQ38_12035 [Acidobacteriota bacterium]REK13141.1 MAG: hypothetical protein DWQ43_05790 [Acidobacteriota bacterium]REK41135.1 MAG: hypothetical protein DWQ47_12700 [Acidobacteriota bacterium]
MGNDRVETFEDLIAFAETRSDVLALSLTGSRSAGFEVPESDFDCALFVVEGTETEVRQELGDIPGALDLRFFTPRSFASHAEWGSDLAWDRYAWFIAKFVVDKSGGELPNAARQKGLVPENELDDWIDGSLDWYLNQVARSVRCITRGDETGGRLECAEAVRPFLQAAFAVHDRRIVPYYKYLRWELDQRPLVKFGLGPDEFAGLVLSLVTSGSLESQRKTLELAEKVFKAHGFGRRFEEWETSKWGSRYFADR